MGARQMVTTSQLGAVKVEPASDPDPAARTGGDAQVRRQPIAMAAPTR